MPLSGHGQVGRRRGAHEARRRELVDAGVDFLGHFAHETPSFGMGDALLEVEEECDRGKEEDESDGRDGKRPVEEGLFSRQLLTQSLHLAHQLLEGRLGVVESLAQILKDWACLLCLLRCADAHSIKDLELNLGQPPWRQEGNSRQRGQRLDRWRSGSRSRAGCRWAQ